jgi:hypothetical protein
MRSSLSIGILLFFGAVRPTALPSPGVDFDGGYGSAADHSESANSPSSNDPILLVKGVSRIS